jgi:hypothetical protein
MLSCKGFRSENPHKIVQVKKAKATALPRWWEILGGLISPLVNLE